MAQYKDSLTSSITHQYWWRPSALWPSISDLKFSGFARGAPSGDSKAKMDTYGHEMHSIYNLDLMSWTNLPFTNANCLNKQIQVQFGLLFRLKTIQYLCVCLLLSGLFEPSRSRNSSVLSLLYSSVFFISRGLSLNWTWAADSQSGVRWKAEKGRRGSRRKNSAGGGHCNSFGPRSLFSWHTTALLPQRPCFPSEYSPSLCPSLNHKRGEQAWAGIIGSFLSASAMCKDSNNGRDREGKWFKVRFSPAPFSEGSAPFRAC